MPEEILHRSDNVKLVKNQKKHNGRKYYQVVITNSFHFTHDEMEQIRNLVDPNRSKSGARGTKWRYISKKAAEQAYFNLLLWS